MATHTQTVVLFVSILGHKDETMTCGMPHKFTLLNLSIIRSLWEIGHNFSLRNPNQVRPVALERRLRGLPKYLILDIEDSKSKR